MGTFKRAKETVAWAKQQHREAAKQRKQEREVAEAAEDRSGRCGAVVVSEIQYEYDPPLRAGVLCQWCGDEIEAWAELPNRSGLVLKGAEHNYAWRHIVSKSAECVRVYRARPYDDWNAQRAIREALRREERDGAS